MEKSKYVQQARIVQLCCNTHNHPRTIFFVKDQSNICTILGKYPIFCRYCADILCKRSEQYLCNIGQILQYMISEQQCCPPALIVKIRNKPLRYYFHKSLGYFCRLTRDWRGWFGRFPFLPFYTFEREAKTSIELTKLERKKNLCEMTSSQTIEAVRDRFGFHCLAFSQS